jgi:hypothetical protein
VGYRLRRTLRLAGQIEEANRVDREVLEYREAFKQARAVLDEITPLPQAGKPLPHGFGAVMADLRRRMGRDREAGAWESFRPDAESEFTRRFGRTQQRGL